MGSTNTGSAALEQQSTPDQDDVEPPQRGFFGRIIDALSPSETSTDGQSAPIQGPVRAVLGASTHGIANLRKLRVDDVAVPKVEITAVPITIGKDELVEVFRENGFSRVPVYKGTLDHPLGLILLKDLALQYGFAGASGKFSLRKMLRPMLYAPPSMPVGVLLQKMQKERVHMALVIDEYGGVDGLVTIEDLIETVIGEIEDEHDEVEGALWKEDPEGVFLAQANAPLTEFEQALGVTLRNSEEDGDVDTLGGLVFLRLGRIPARGEIIPHESGAEFEVVEADPRRIKRIRVRRPGAARRLTPAEAKAAVPAEAKAAAPAEAKAATPVVETKAAAE